MNTTPTDRKAVEAAIVSLQECLSNGDPSDVGLISQSEAVLSALRAAYRVTPDAFSHEALEALRELSEFLSETGPAAHAGTPNKGRGQ